MDTRKIHGQHDAGAPDRINAGDYLGGDTAISFMAWVKPDDVSVRSDFVAHWKSSGNGSATLLQGVTTTKRAQFFVNFLSPFDSSGPDTADLSITVWTHLAGTWASGSPIRLYRNSVNTVSSGNVTLTTNTGATDLIISGNDGGGDSVDGGIDEAQIHDVELHADWIDLEVKQTETGGQATFWGTWAFVEPGGGTPYYYRVRMFL